MTKLTDRPAEVYGLLSRLTGDEKHDPSSHSTLDVLWVLYDRVLRVSPATVADPARDRFLLSKGHGPAAYYAVLAAKGFFDVAWLDHLGGFDSPLGHHPDNTMIPGVEISSGSLGHGLGLAIGTALGLRAQGYLEPRVFVLLGDAELDEGSNHEAIAYAAAAGVPLTAIVIDNQSATHGWPGGIAARFIGWPSTVVNGRDHDDIEQALRRSYPDTPNVIVATVATKDTPPETQEPPQTIETDPQGAAVGQGAAGTQGAAASQGAAVGQGAPGTQGAAASQGAGRRQCAKGMQGAAVGQGAVGTQGATGAHDPGRQGAAARQGAVGGDGARVVVGVRVGV